MMCPGMETRASKEDSQSTQIPSRLMCRLKASKAQFMPQSPASSRLSSPGQPSLSHKAARRKDQRERTCCKQILSVFIAYDLQKHDKSEARLLDPRRRLQATFVQMLPVLPVKISADQTRVYPEFVLLEYMSNCNDIHLFHQFKSQYVWFTITRWLPAMVAPFVFQAWDQAMCWIAGKQSLKLCFKPLACNTVP